MSSAAYRRIKIFSLDEILPAIRSDTVHSINHRHTDESGQTKIITFSVSGSRLKTYGLYGVSCARCGIAGQFFALETHKCLKNPGRRLKSHWHLNLYAKHTNNHEVLMTSDHIHPVSKGGSDSLLNRQPMCARCNSKKADDPVSWGEMQALRFRHVNRVIFGQLANCVFSPNLDILSKAGHYLKPPADPRLITSSASAVNTGKNSLSKKNTLICTV